MGYISVADTAKKWNVSERTVRNYCAHDKIPGAFLMGKTWNIPDSAQKPMRQSAREESRDLLTVLRAEKKHGIKGGIYHKIQVDLTYNSNHIEGSRLSHDQTRYMYETNTIGVSDQTLNVDDIVETANHFRCIDLVIDNANNPLSEKMIKELHLILKSGTQDSRKEWFAALPEEVPQKMKKLLATYREHNEHTLDDILDFHHEFENIHPFQDGNGRVGRLILFKECLKYDIVPFIIDEDLKWYYYRGLSEWNRERGYLRDTCLTAQDKFKRYLDYFRIQYRD